MLVKVTTSGPRRYVQLVESYRDETGRVKKRTVATLGRLDQLTGQLDAVIEGPAQSLWPSASGCQNGCVCSCCSLLLLPPSLPHPSRSTRPAPWATCTNAWVAITSADWAPSRPQRCTMLALMRCARAMPATKAPLFRHSRRTWLLSSGLKKTSLGSVGVSGKVSVNFDLATRSGTMLGRGVGRRARRERGVKDELQRHRIAGPTPVGCAAPAGGRPAPRDERTSSRKAPAGCAAPRPQARTIPC